MLQLTSQMKHSIMFGTHLGHVKDMRLYEGEGRHEEQSGSGRQAGRHHQQSTDDDDDDNRDELEQCSTLLVAANTVSTTGP